MTRIPSWKFDALRDAILDAVACAQPDGLPFSELKVAVSERLDPDTLARLGSLGWHVTTVKLELECRGELHRAAHSSVQRLHIANPANKGA